MQAGAAADVQAAAVAVPRMIQGATAPEGFQAHCYAAVYIAAAISYRFLSQDPR
jgi:hypothetical protein